MMVVVLYIIEFICKHYGKYKLCLDEFANKNNGFRSESKLQTNQLELK